MFKYIRFLVGALLLLGSDTLSATSLALDLIKPYDTFLWTSPRDQGTFQIDAYGAHSFHERGVRFDHAKVCNVLQIWQCDQNALAMVKGFSPSSEKGQLEADLNDVVDNGVRGHLVPSAHLSMAEFGVGAKYWFPHHFSFGIFLPIVSMRLQNVQWCDCTKEESEGDFLVKDLLTDDFCQTVLDLGGANVCSSWKRTGIGDLSTVLRWERDFPQSKPILTNVMLSAYLGLSFPTGKREDDDKLFALPFGYDGSPGILFGGGLNLFWKHHFKGGVELNMTQLIGDTRLRRIKTSYDQTELLLLAKTPVHIDWGFLQRYRLYLGAHNIIRGFSFDVNYQFQKQGNSTYSMCSNECIATIANSAESLKEWTLHQIGVDASYDFDYDLAETVGLTPTVIFFYRKAFKGKRSVLMDKWGFSFVLSF